MRALLWLCGFPVWAFGSVFQMPLEKLPCPDYSSYSFQKHGPYSRGRYRLPYQRPDPECRRITLPEVEDTIAEMKKAVKDPDLARLFENCFPNTLDTAIAWKGVADKPHGAKKEEVIDMKENKSRCSE
jgi:Metal-independent alpha-mannosidase (GH125)